MNDTRELEARVARLVAESDSRTQAGLASRLAPSADLGGGAPTDPIVGYTPFDVVTLIASGAVDWATLAASLIGTPVASTRGVPNAGVALQIPRSDHDHGLVKGPPSVDLAITYTGALPATVTRTDTPGGVVSATVINYVGAHISSVVTTRTGYVITVTPAYTVDAITSIHRAVA